MTMILRFFAAALLVVLFAVVLGVTVANSPIIGVAAQNTPHLALMTKKQKLYMIHDKKSACKEDIPFARYDDIGESPLHCAAWDGDAKTALSLVKEGERVMVINQGGATPLDIAIIRHGKDSVIALVLQRAMEKEASKNRQEADELLRDLE